MFDRTTWIAIALSVAGLVGWQYYYSKTYAPYIARQAEEQRIAKQKVEISKSSTSTKPATSPADVPVPAPATAATPTIPSLSTKRETLDTSRAEYLFAGNTGGIEAVTLFLHLGVNQQSLLLKNDQALPI